MANPAEQLEGLTLAGGWNVGKLDVKLPQATGGNFSRTYTATSPSGKKAFLKALDFYAAFSSGQDITRTIQRTTELFNFEKDMLIYCEQRRMDRIVRAIDSGTVKVDATPLGEVPYLIFEAADCDLRSHLDDPKHGLGIAWRLRALHHVTVGLKQLHGAEIAHQDLKPSNVLVFDSQVASRQSKIGDLGRVSRSGSHSPFDELDWPGDRHYAPPEVHYGFIQTDFFPRRVGSDLYMLGSLVSFVFTRNTSISALFRILPLQFWPANWDGTFEQVLPYLYHSFADAIAEFADELPPKLADDLVPIYKHLCEPDPRKRGLPGQVVSKIALEKFVSRFDLLSRKADIGRYSVA